MPKPIQPNFILDVEMSELFIQAGLQDRVIQVSMEVLCRPARQLTVNMCRFTKGWSTWTLTNL